MHMAKNISTGVARATLKASAGQVHEVPTDLRKALMSDRNPTAEKWEDITPSF
jgi:hypothetical protein